MGNCLKGEHERAEQAPLLGRNTTAGNTHNTRNTGNTYSRGHRGQADTRSRSNKREPALVRRVVEQLNAEGKYSVQHGKMCLGMRLQKFWSNGTLNISGSRILVSVAPLSVHCAPSVEDDSDTVNSLLAKLGRHPLLHRIHEVRCQELKVVMVQPLIGAGSLRDYLQRVLDPLKDWVEKYSEEPDKGRRVKREEISLCGRSILEAADFLYEQGFPPLGHIQTGNIFKTTEGYRLGGYENTLLGYKSKYHDLCQEYSSEDLDIIMFGHVIYEMATGGRELTSMVPSTDDSCYKHVKDKEVMRVLKLIFDKVSQENDYRTSLRQILEDEFFIIVPEGRISSSYKCNLTEREEAILSDISGGTERHLRRPRPENLDKDKYADVMNYYLTRREYPSVSTGETLVIGTRSGKVWGKVQKRDSYNVQLVSVDNVSGDCPIVLTPTCLAAIKKCFLELKHPNLLPVDDLKFYDGQVLLLQQFKEQGSLRDKIYSTEPWSRWNDKAIVTSGQSLSKESIIAYAKQILKGCSVLYGMGFPQLGHIQSGNIFLEGDSSVRLAGFENTLLGYTTANTKFLQYQAIDRVMFGHVVFEMGAGCVSENVMPSEGDYEKIKDKSVRKMVREIFTGIDWSPTKPQATTTDWIQTVFSIFSPTEPLPFTFNVDDGISEEMRDILRKVRKGKPRKQRSLGQTGSSVKKMLRTSVKPQQ